MKKSIILFLLLLPISVFAYSDRVIVGGQNIGIELKTEGVMVTGFYRLNNSYNNSNLQIGDLITSVDNENVNSIKELTNIINTKTNDNIKIGYMRNDILNYTNLKLYKDESNNYKTGIYVKDSVSGIGTLTYIDPNTNLFGALGHEITEKNTGKILDIKDGQIYKSEVTNIIASDKGSPGEKNARLYSNDVLGNIFENTSKGIFGSYKGKYDNTKLYKVAKNNEIKKGKAKILTVLDGYEVNEYDINILKLINNQKTKNILFEIIDTELLNKTNGIIQGMSGSPIIQDEYIIGAVTHVVIDNPTKGYGIYITNMLEEAEN